MNETYDGPVPSPWEDEGSSVLDAAEKLLSRFVVFPSEATRVATVLWCAHTHVVDAFETTPRLAFLSPEPGSGKTRALEIVELLSANPLLSANMTPAYLMRRLAGDPRPTVLFDEIDTVFGPKAKTDNEELRGLLNSGYRAGATSGRCVTRGNNIETEDFPSFAAVALAGLDDLPDTVATRSVIVRMQRRAPGEKVEPYRRRLHEPQGHAIREDLGRWAHSQFDQLRDAWPDLPDGCEDRNADVWEPLLAIADAAGGDWPERARISAISLISDSQTRRGGLGVKLLEDIRAVMAGSSYIGTDELLRALNALEESPWHEIKGGHELDARALAWRLSKYEIKPKQIFALGRKGYRAEDMQDAWTRYLPPLRSPESEMSEMSEMKIA